MATLPFPRCPRFSGNCTVNVALSGLQPTPDHSQALGPSLTFCPSWTSPAALPLALVLLLRLLLFLVFR